MSVSMLMDAFGLPADTRVDQRIPKTLLLERGARTANDRRRIRGSVQEMSWLATLKPTTIGVRAFSDEAHEYLEIAIVAAVLRDDSNSRRIIELIHRAIPYPVVLCVEYDGVVSLALAHKRRSQGEFGEVVLEESCRTPPMRIGALSKPEQAFAASLSVAALPTPDLYVLYQAWFDRVVALEASLITGKFVIPESLGRAAARLAALTAYARLERDLAVLRLQAQRERQLNRRVDINLAVKRLESELTKAVRAL